MHNGAALIVNPIDMARSTWPDRQGPIDKARSTRPDRQAAQHAPFWGQTPVSLAPPKAGQRLRCHFPRLQD
jgi:hypothetical protein